MRIYLIRHAEAVDGADDAGRRLSPRGKEQVEELIRFFEKNGKLEPAAVWHSSLVRSRETAAQMAKGLGWKCPQVEVDGVEPGDDPKATARRLKDAGESLAIIGHEPHLSALASILLRGAAFPAIVTMKKGACLALDRDPDGGCRIRWLVSPSLL